MVDERIPVEFEPFREEEFQTSSTGYVSYEPVTGAILSISLRRDENDPAPFVEIPASHALSFLEGENKMHEWIVSQDEHGETVLMSPYVELVVTSSEMKLVGADTTLKMPVGIAFQYPKGGGAIGVRMITKFPHARVFAESDVAFDIMVTPKGMPEVMVKRVRVPVRDLAERRFYRIPLEDGCVPDVWTYPLAPVSYWVEEVEPDAVPISLPHSRFEDVQWFQYAVAPTQGLMLAHDVAQRTLSFRLEGTGGIRYDRSLSNLRIVLCRTQSPDDYIWSFKIDVDTLMQGETVVVALSPLVSEENFEVFTQKLFVNLFRVERF